MKINKCRSCSSKKFLKVLSLGDQSLSDFTKSKKKLKAFPLNLVLCKNCFLVQLDFTTPQKYLYTERYGYESGINQTMQDELREIVLKSLNKIKNKNKNIIAVDIGSNDGTLLKYYPKRVYKIGVEPVSKLAKKSKKYADKIVNSFFDYEVFRKSIGNKKADIVTVISCFYDMDNPNQFVEDLKRIMNEDGICVIQQNYLVEMLRLCAFDNIVHEHLEYYSLLSLNNLLNKHGLEVFDVEQRELNGGSFRTYIAFKGKRKISKSVKQMILTEKKLKLNKKEIYVRFAKKIQQNRIKLLDFIKKQNKFEKIIYLYGASTRGNTLLQYYKLNNKLIKKAVERNSEKWGKVISSVSIPIISEKEARKDKPDYMLVLPWFFKKEFLKREKKYLKTGGHFIFPLPKLEIV